MVYTSTFDLIVGGLGIFLNLAVALALRLDVQMRGATSDFMIQLALADALALFGQMFGPAIAWLIGYKLTPEMTIGRLIVFCNGSGYYASGVFVALISFSRWVYFGKKLPSDIVFSPGRYRFACIFIWLSVFIIHAPFIFQGNNFRFLSNSGVFAYTNSTYSQTLLVFDWTFDIFSAFVQILFNTLAIFWIIKMRKQVLTPELRSLNRKELRLFAMCFIDSAVFVIMVVMSVVDVFFVHSIILDIGNEAMLLANHLDCSVLYLCLNMKVRSAMSQFIKKIFCKCATSVQQTPVFQLTPAGGGSGSGGGSRHR